MALRVLCQPREPRIQHPVDVAASIPTDTVYPHDFESEWSGGSLVLDEVLARLVSLGMARDMSAKPPTSAARSLCGFNTRCPSHVLSRSPNSLRSPPAPGHPPSSIRIHRQEVDDVGPVLTVLVAVAQEFGRDRRGSRSLNIRHGVRDLTTRNEPTARTINETTAPLRPAAALASEADPITLTLKPSAKRAEKIMSHPTSLT